MLNSTPLKDELLDKSDDGSVVEFRAYIEREVLAVLKDKVTKGELASDKIQEIASYALDLLEDPDSIDELYRNAIKLDDVYNELGGVVILLMRKYEEKYNGKAVSKVSDLIKSGNYDEAQDMIKKVLLYKGV